MGRITVIHSTANQRKKNSSYLDLHSVTKEEYQFENKQFTRLSKKESEKNNILSDKAMC